MSCLIRYLTHGFRISFAVLTGLAIVGVVLASVTLRPRREEDAVPTELAELREAA